MSNRSDGSGNTAIPDILLHVRTNGNVPYVINPKQNAEAAKTGISCRYWTLPPSKKRVEKPVQGPLPSTVKLVRSNLVYIEKKGLLQAMLNQLIRLAAFQNPDF